MSFWKDKFLKVISFIKDKLFGKETEQEKYMNVAEITHSIFYTPMYISDALGYFEDLQDTYEFSKKHDSRYESEKDRDFEI